MRGRSNVHSSPGSSTSPSSSNTTTTNSTNGSRPHGAGTTAAKKPLISQHSNRGGGGASSSSSSSASSCPSSVCHSWWLHALLFFLSMAVAMLYGLFTWHLLFQAQQQRQEQQPLSSSSAFLPPHQQDNQPDSLPASCSFRPYAPHRFYQLSQPKDAAPDFLKSVPYIYGQWPLLLRPSTTTTISTRKVVHKKLCVDQSEWRNATTTTTWPFADGTNPSILSMTRYQQFVAPEHQQQFDRQNIAWMATVCMTNSQCLWKETLDQIHDLHLKAQQTTPDTVRTVLLFLNDNFETLVQATIYLKLDAPRYGKPGGSRFLRSSSQSHHHLPALDDARLFLYQGQVWISYREGRLFGYDVQVLNPLHISMDDNNHKWTATIWASETTSFCCGRNMALLTPTHTGNSNAPLLSVTWVDPVTVITVDTTPHLQLHQQQAKQQRRRLQEEKQQQEQQNEDNSEPRTQSNLTESRWPPPLPPFVLRQTSSSFAASSMESPSEPLWGEEQWALRGKEQLEHRQLSEAKANKNKLLKKPKSHVHGTNAFMVYLPQRREYLGIAHFHRPNDREPNPYARFGHHYTHAFYTIPATTPSMYQSLATLSQEFVLPAASAPPPLQDAEIIQFISGLEYDATTKEIVLAYGINDCEGAVMRLDYETVVKPLLKAVPPPLESSSSAPQYLQVVDLMEPLKL
ncbi:hypothetical protein ACA910_011711 [Epithemia clementina (nom. ined.)]